MDFKNALRFSFTIVSSCMFGIALLCLIGVTSMIELPLPRFDALFLSALLIQIFLVAFRYEHTREVVVIGIFHILGTCMELFKTSMGSWQYSGDGFFMIGSVPLFAGFMYASVGSAIARSIRLFSIEFIELPKRTALLLLAASIYINFFTHHFVYDIRYIIIICIIGLFARTQMKIAHAGKTYTIHFLLGAVSVACAIWFAENVATYLDIWRYPHQADAWRPVHIEKITSWFLLMLVSFALVTTAVPQTNTKHLQ